MLTRNEAKRLVIDYLSYVLWTRQYSNANADAILRTLSREWWLENARGTTGGSSQGDLGAAALSRDISDLRNGRLSHEPRPETFETILRSLANDDRYRVWDSANARLLDPETAVSLVVRGSETVAVALAAPLRVSIEAESYVAWRDGSRFSPLHPVALFRPASFLSAIADAARAVDEASLAALSPDERKASPVSGRLTAMRLSPYALSSSSSSSSSAPSTSHYLLSTVEYRRDGTMKQREGDEIAEKIIPVLSLVDTNVLLRTSLLPPAFAEAGYVVFAACDDATVDDCLTGNDESSRRLIYVLSPPHSESENLYYVGSDVGSFSTLSRLRIGLTALSPVSSSRHSFDAQLASQSFLRRCVERLLRWCRAANASDASVSVVYDSFLRYPDYSLSYAMGGEIAGASGGGGDSSVVSYETHHRDRMLLRLLRRYDFLVERRLPAGRGVNFPAKLRAPNERWRRYEDATSRDRQGGEAARIEHRGRDPATGEALLLVQRAPVSTLLSSRWRVCGGGHEGSDEDEDEHDGYGPVDEDAACSAKANRTSTVLLADALETFAGAVEKIRGGGKRFHTLNGSPFLTDPAVKFVGASKLSGSDGLSWLKSEDARSLVSALKLDANRGRVLRFGGNLLVVSVFREAATLYFPLALSQSDRDLRYRTSTTARCYENVSFEIARSIERADDHFYGRAAS